MSTDELFPVELVSMDSPRLAWLKMVREGRTKHGKVRTHYTADIAFEDDPWCAWFDDNSTGPDGEGMPDNPDACGYGATEEDALINLATGYGVPLWNEQS